MFSRRPLLIVDVETTGLDPTIHDVIEIGAIKVDQQTLQECGRFSTKIQPWFIHEPSQEALLVNGYRREDWIESITLHQAMRSFALFAQAGILGAWNVTFEYGFLKESFKRTGIADTMDYHRIDIPSIVWSKMRGLEKFSLSDVAEELGLGLEPEPHQAITGAQYELEVLRKLMM